jgi:hypothetical protein
MRALVMAPYGTDLEVLRRVLSGLDVTTEASTDLAAGALLATVPLEEFDFALAVVPAQWKEQAGASAIFVEIGVVLGKSMPVALVVEPPASPPPALASLAYIPVGVHDEAQLHFHLRWFLSTLEASAPTPLEEPGSGQSRLSSEDVSGFRQQLRRVRLSAGGDQALEFERLVIDLLRRSGAVVEEMATRPDEGIDAVAYIPGAEQRLGPVLIELKVGHLSSTVLRRATTQLQSYVLTRRGGLGILIYDSPSPIEVTDPPAPLVLSIRVEDLLNELEGESLTQVLVRARNAAVHRM